MNSDMGRLNVMPKMRSGKKMDEWTFHSPFGNTLRIVVKAVQVNKLLMIEASAVEVGARRAKMFDPIRATDIETLRALTLEACIAYDQICNGVKWVDWLEVIIYRPANKRGYVTNNAELLISYQVIKKATLESGREVYINRNDRVMDFPKPKAAGEVDEVKHGSWGSSREVNSEFSYLPSTPENIATLDAMIEGLDALHSRIALFTRAAGVAGKIQFNNYLQLMSK